MRFEEKRLPNGLRIIHIPLPKEDRRFYLSALIPVGSCGETQVPFGTAHFLEHMMFRGSENYPSFAALSDAFEWLGGEWNGETGQEYTQYTYLGSSKVYAEAIRLFGEFLRKPAFCDLERERKVILQEISDELNEFGHSTDMDSHRTALIWPNSPFAHLITGSKETVRAITLRDLETYREQFYSCSHLILCSVGAIPTDEIMDVWEKAFATYPLTAGNGFAPIRDYPSFSGPQLKFIEHSDSQHHIQMSFVCMGESQRQQGDLEILIRILCDGFSSRFPHRLREELGIVYDVQVHANQHWHKGSVDISASVNPENVLAFCQEAWAILQSMVEKGPTSDEVKKAQLRSQVDLDLYENDPDSLAFRVSWHLAHGSDPDMTSLRQQIAQATQEKMTALAREIFTKSNLALVVLGPKNPIESELKKFVKNLTKL